MKLTTKLQSFKLNNKNRKSILDRLQLNKIILPSELKEDHSTIHFSRKTGGQFSQHYRLLRSKDFFESKEVKLADAPTDPGLYINESTEAFPLPTTDSYSFGVSRVFIHPLDTIYGTPFFAKEPPTVNLEPFTAVIRVDRFITHLRFKWETRTFSLEVSKIGLEEQEVFHKLFIKKIGERDFQFTSKNDFEANVEIELESEREIETYSYYKSTLVRTKKDWDKFEYKLELALAPYEVRDTYLTQEIPKTWSKSWDLTYSLQRG